ncbi:phosphatidylinositol-specific phospholipase C/glycerophosphodiester phosphodiesterase family protein [Microvirga aerilata]|uniref:Altered inheritance of mitochondria protein 6 n=1 Tax=Microvirga aerilata TaxID=670292 RepID=A0A936ZJF5_9HYPH|nr:phosphatidylinositol-specific phospholipase C/glycerophosphodiester phosphodiesterase family protein [Microvirga aerilata]MBL0408229.1 phosphatidylinositol-specific phospholipase C/glycerophosphodiester phosphodiesterase family protein [Microvirga aerilata]
MKALLLAAALALTPLAAVGADVNPLPQAHAHNDYEHPRPLLDALDHGFTGVEADIWLVNGKLLVAHEEAHIKPERTLEALYLDPLKKRVTENGGRVYPGTQGFTLLIDIKTEGEPTYKALAEVLSKYPDILTVVRDGKVQPGAVTAVVSGNRPREYMLSEKVRYAGYDGRMPDLTSDTPAAFMPLLSDNWTKVFTWKGDGEMPAAERAKLQDIVKTAHSKGWTIRFWATPDQPGPQRNAIWKELKAAGVDKINTDDLAGLQRFLSE